MRFWDYTFGYGKSRQQLASIYNPRRFEAQDRFLLNEFDML